MAEPKETGRVLAIDVGLHKLLSDSDGRHYGREFKVIRDKICRSKPKSNARYRHYRERTNYINRAVNQLPWSELRAIGHELLTDMKRGKNQTEAKHSEKLSHLGPTALC
jgi:transposase